jgi:hypothetical protein
MHNAALHNVRWREASTGVDRHAQLDQVDYIGDRHGLVLIAKLALEVRAVGGGVPTRARSAARCPAGAPAEAGVPGRPGNTSP